MDANFPISSFQRATGKAELHIDNTKITRLYQSGSSKIFLPKTYSSMREAVLANTAGGITGGDSFAAQTMVSSSSLVITSQTAERLYRSITTPARINIDLHAENGAILHWLPQETIIFNEAAAERTINLNMSKDSTVLLAETLVFGRQAMGEQVHDCHFVDHWRLYREGSLFHAEALRLTDKIQNRLQARAAGNSARMLTTIFYASMDVEAQCQRIKPFIDLCSSLCAISSWEDKIIIRLIATDPLIGRADVNRILSVIRGEALPRVWQI